MKKPMTRIKHLQRWCLHFILLLGIIPVSVSAQITLPQAEEILARMESNLVFERNDGQFSPHVYFQAVDRQATYQFREDEVRTRISGIGKDQKFYYSMIFDSPSENVQVRGGKRVVNPKKGQMNYLTEEGLISNVPFVSDIYYDELWEGIEAHFYEGDEGMKYDFIVKPGADPSKVRFTMKGVEGLSVNAKGELLFRTPLGELKKGKPYTYQVVDGEEVPVSSQYQLDGKKVQFDIGAYDTSLPLYIDPVALKYSTFLGQGTSTFLTNAIEYHDGKIYLSGFVEDDGSSFGYPPTHTVGESVSNLQSTNESKAFIMVLTAQGDSVISYTLFNYSFRTSAQEIEVDEVGNVFVVVFSKEKLTGLTPEVSGVMPVMNTSHDAGTNYFPYACLFKFDESFSQIKYFTYIQPNPEEDNHWEFAGNYVGRTDEKLYNDLRYLGNGKVAMLLMFEGNADTEPTAFTPAGYYNNYFELDYDDVGSIFILNTEVAGESGLEAAAYLCDVYLTGLDADANGNIYVTGLTYYGDLARDYITYNDPKISFLEDLGITDELDCMVKLSPDLTEVEFGRYIYFPMKATADIDGASSYLNPDIKVDAAGNVFLANTHELSLNNNFQTSLPNGKHDFDADQVYFTQEFMPEEGDSTDSYVNFNYVLKCAADDLGRIEWINILPGYYYEYNGPDLDIDDFGNVHVFYSLDEYWTYLFTPPSTPGALQTITLDDSYWTLPVYARLRSNGSLEYSTPIYYGFGRPDSYEDLIAFMTVDKASGTAYTVHNLFKPAGHLFPVTPSYYDYDTERQVEVLLDETPSGSNFQTLLAVFHDARVGSNLIDTIPANENDFCAGSLIGIGEAVTPISGTAISFQSGDGSSELHNLPLINYGGVLFDHPKPANPKPRYQWQISEDGGVAWSNVQGGTKKDLKPQIFESNDTIMYRRLVITGIDTVISNTSTINVSGTFSLGINGPEGVMYFCPGDATDLGISITGATGDITWRWYNGFEPLDSNIINPVSGSGPAASFTANVDASLTKNSSGFYRLVVEDQTGCKLDYQVSILPLTASIYDYADAYFCPGLTELKIGPKVINPDFDYQITGPNGYLETIPNPILPLSSADTGLYALQVKLTSQTTYCPGGETTVSVQYSNPHDALLTPLQDVGVCQSGPAASIGLSSAEPADYNFSWFPELSTGKFWLDDLTAFNPSFRPDPLPFGNIPIDVVDFVFSAQRTTDRCVYQDQMILRDTAAPRTNISSFPRVVNGCVASNKTYYNYDKDSYYFEWRLLSTNYPGGTAALEASPDYGLNTLGNINPVNTKNVTLFYPAAVNQFVQVKLLKTIAYLPLDQTNCVSLDTLVFEIRPIDCGSGNPGGFACEPITDFTSDEEQNITCGTAVPLSAQVYDWESATWTIVEIDGTPMPEGFAPRGLFYDQEGYFLPLDLFTWGEHPEKVTAMINDSTWGYPSAEYIVYRFTGNYRDDDGSIGTCVDEITVYSPNYLPKFELGDPIEACAFPGPGVKVSATTEVPYTFTSSDYVTPPDAANYQLFWGVGDDTLTISDRNALYPTFSPTTTTTYQLRLYDPATRCSITDTKTFNIRRLTISAGNDIPGYCPGNFLELTGVANSVQSFKWTPDSLTFYYPDAMTPNDTVLTPFILGPATSATGLTLTLTGTDSVSGCVVSDEIVITSDPGGPETFSSDTYEACANAKITIGPSGYTPEIDYVYAWTAETGADISWLDDPNILYPTVNLPSDFTTNATFRLTVNKGADAPCGTPATNTFTIQALDPGLSLPDQVTLPNCTDLADLSVSVSSSYTLLWLPYAGLYEDNGSSYFNYPYTGDDESYIYAKPTTTTTYTLVATHEATGCRFTDEVEVMTSGVEAGAGDDVFYCAGTPVQIGETATGGTIQWTAVGYDPNPTGQATKVPDASLQSTMLSWLSSTASPTPNFSQTVLTPGAYRYRVTVDPSSCNVSDEIIVRVRPFEEGLAGNNTTVCKDLAFQGGVENTLQGYDFEWSVLSPSDLTDVFDDPNQARPMITLSQKATLEILYTDQLSGCEYSDIVAYDLAPPLELNDLVTDTFCEIATNLDLISYFTDYDSLLVPTWYKNIYPSVAIAPANAETVTKTTSYFLRAENKFGCEKVAEVLVPIEQPETPVVFSNLTIVPGDSLVELMDYVPDAASVPGGTFAWYSDSIPNATYLIANTEVPKGTYYIFETGPAGCSGDFATLTADYAPSTLRGTTSGDTSSSIAGFTFSLSSINYDKIEGKTGLFVSLRVPSGLMVLDGTPVNTCGGTLTANVGDTIITLSNAAIAAGGSCKVELKVGGKSGSFEVSNALIDSLAGWNPVIPQKSIFLDPNFDTDGDGVTDSVEVSQMTDLNDPCDPVQEPDYASYDANNAIWRAADCDNDSIPNGMEDSLQTNPYMEDTDGDGEKDLDELNASPSTDPTDPCDPIQEATYTGYDSTNVVWQMADCDGDSLLNGVEDSLQLSPYLNDTDGDGFSDGEELDGDPNDDPTNPCLPPQDTGYVGYDSTNVVWQMADCDGDSISNFLEVTYGMDPYVFSPDTDGDGILNSLEIANGNDPFDPCDPVQPIGYTGYVAGNAQWASADCDGDGTDNTTELGDSTDPYDPCAPAQMEGYTGYVDTNIVWQAADCDMDELLNGWEDSVGADPYAIDPNFSLQGNDSVIANGSTTFSEANLTDFGARNLNSVKRHRFQVKNYIPGANGPLTTGPIVTLTGGDGMFVVEFEQDCDILPSGEAPIIIRYQPTAEGCHTATISIPHSDTSKPNPYTFQVQGKTKNATCE